MMLRYFETHSIIHILTLFIEGNELEEDLEILEEASLQVFYLFNQKYSSRFVVVLWKEH